MSKYVILDIETIPAQRPDIHQFVVEGLAAPANYKDPEKIAAYIDGQKDEAIRKTALEGWAGETWCIGWAVDDGPVTVETRAFWEPSEYVLLEKWLGAMRNLHPTWIGHNVLWDLRFLWQRCKVNGLDTTGVDFALDAKPWDNTVADTMTMWAGARDRISLKKLALAFGLTAKDDMDGSKVWDAVKAGEWEKVRDYCAADVELTREIWRRLT